MNVSGRLEQKNDVSVYTDGVRSLNFDVPTLTFTKPAGPSDTNRTGTCQFFVYNVPPYHPYFDLELSVFRGAGQAQTVSVKLEVMHTASDGTGVLKTFNGSVAVPARSPVILSRRVDWHDGEYVTAFDGEERRMPWFLALPDDRNLGPTKPKTALRCRSGCGRSIGKRNPVHSRCENAVDVRRRVRTAALWTRSSTLFLCASAFINPSPTVVDARNQHQQHFFLVSNGLCFEMPLTSLFI